MQVTNFAPLQKLDLEPFDMISNYCFIFFNLKFYKSMHKEKVAMYKYNKYLR